MNFKVTFILALLLISCKKEANKNAILVIGHAGMGLEFSGSVYHDNSEEAFQLAFDIQEVDGVEMDVRLSADGDLWAFHDENLQNATNQEGCIENMTFAQLNGLKYKGTGSEKLMRLKDMNLAPKEKSIFLDIKHFNACNGTVHNINDYIAALNELPSYYHNTSFVRMVTSNADWIPALIAGGYQVVFSSDVQTEIDAVFENYPAINGVMIKNKYTTKVQVEKYKNDGKSVYIYEVRSAKSMKEAGKKLPTAVLSDDVQGAVLEYK